MQKPQKLRIGMLASNFIRIPPDPPEKYIPKEASGAPETMVYLITEELVKRGHDVTLFASGDSETSAKLVSVTDTATWSAIGIGPHEHYERLLISKAYQMAKEGHFDIIHSHFDIRSAHFAPLVNTPTIATLHSPIDGMPREIMQHYKTTQYYASISDNQRKGLPDLQYAVTAYNGIRVEDIPYSTEKDDYFIFAGRITEQKGVAETIEIAKRTKRRLLLFGSRDVESNYWKKRILPHIDGEQIVDKGFTSREKLFEYMSKAEAFVFPLQWEEPFGLVSVETMATGTPVIALAKGSLPEIIEDGKTGFLCNTIDEMVEAVAKLDTIKPEDCRKRVEDMFTIEKVVDRYEQAYYSILEKEGKP